MVEVGVTIGIRNVLRLKYFLKLVQINIVHIFLFPTQTKKEVIVKLTQSRFNEMLEFVKSGVASKEVMEQSTHVVFDSKCMSTFNDFVFAAIPLKELDFKAAVPASVLMSIVKKLPDGPITLALKDDKMVVRSAHTTVQIKSSPEVLLDISEIPSSMEWVTIPADFMDGLRLCETATSKTFSAPILTAIHLTSNYMEGCDNFRAVRITFDEDLFGDNHILLPNKLFSGTGFGGIDFCEYGFAEGWFGLRTKIGETIVCRTYPEADYPDVSMLFEEIEGISIPLPPELRPALERADTIVGVSNNVVQGDVLVKISGDKLTVHGDGSLGTITERIRTDKSIKEDVSFIVSPIALMDILKRTESAQVGENKILFTSENMVYAAALSGEEG